MTTLEKQLLRRVESLERRWAEMMARMGMDPAAMDEYERTEAIEAMVRGNGPELIKEHLRKVNGRKSCSANT
jgi:hypothetical protein